MECLLNDPFHSKHISTYYSSLLHSKTDRLDNTETRWRLDIPEITEEVWQEIFPLQVPMVISSKDKVTETTFLYRSYYTPCLLFQLDRLPSAACSRCSWAEGYLYHMVWECPQVRVFWSQVTTFISLITQIPNICNPLICLFGYIDDESLFKNSQLFLRLDLFYATKSMTMHWKSPNSPTIAFWLTVVNQTLPLYKLTYEARGCPRKFHKIWDLGVSSDCTIPPNTQGTV